MTYSDLHEILWEFVWDHCSTDKLTEEDERFIWSKECDDAFDKLRSVLCSEPVLRAPDFGKQFILMVDASEHMVSAVLMQSDDNLMCSTVYVTFQLFNCHQKNYSTVEKEPLTQVLALRHSVSMCLPFSHLYFVFMYTDHNSLYVLMQASQAS